MLIALYRLTLSSLDELLLEALNPLDPRVFQRIFGGIMTLLIALKFNHTLKYVVCRGCVGGLGVGSRRDLLAHAGAG